MNNITPIAKLGNLEEILFINKTDIPFIGKERAMEVMCVRVDFGHKSIDETIELEKHLKFNPWEEIMTDDERKLVESKLNETFTDTEQNEKISRPLIEKMIK